MSSAIALVALAVSLAVSGAAFAQSSSPAPDATGPAPQATAGSAWDAPEPWRTDRFYLGTSVRTHHFSYDPAHDDRQNLIRGEWNITEEWLAGAAVFDNSFGQASQYVYGGYRFRPLAHDQPFFLKVSAGLVHGYRGQYRDKIPFNHSGIAPVIVPSAGYCISRVCSELAVFGGAGVLLTLGITIP